MNEIIVQNKVFARYSSSDFIEEGVNFYSKDEDALQIGTWCYKKDKILNPHFHNKFSREISTPCEVIFVLNGAILVDVYDFNNEKVESVVIKKGGVIILLDGGHGFKIIEDDTRVIEVKNGPYTGTEKDKTWI